MNNKIKRSIVDCVHEGLPPNKVRKIVTFDSGDREFELHFRRTLRSRLNLDVPASQSVRYRELLAWVTQDGVTIATIKATEIDVPDLFDSNDFFFQMDGHSEQFCELAEVIVGSWTYPDDIWLNGSVVEISRVWVAPEWSNGRLFKDSISVFIDAVDANASLVLAKAFPLEYEGHVTQENEERFKRRQQAMVRHYSRKFLLNPVSDRFPEWLYRFPDGFSFLCPPDAE